MAPITQRREIDETLVLKRRWITLALLTLTYFFSFMDRQILAILLEPIKRDLSLSDTQLGLLSGLVFAIFYATLGIPIARLADRTSRRNIIAASLAVWSVMTALCGVAQNFTQLLLARVGVGVGEAGAGPPSQSIIADLYPPEKRASAMAIYSLGVLLGGGLGIMIGGNVAHAYGWRAAMLVVGIPGIVLALIVRLFVAEPRRGLSDVQRVAEEETEPLPSMWRGFLAMLHNPAAVHLVAGMTLTSLVGYALTGWGPSYMQRSMGMSMLTVANYIALPAALVGGASALLGGAIADRMAKRYGLHAQAWVIAAMKTIAFPFAVSFYFFDSVPVALGAYFVSLLFAGVYLGPTYALIQHLAPLRLRAMWAALTLLMVNLIGLGLGPLAVGRLSDLMQPALGDQSLRYAMLAVAMMTPVPIFLYWRAGVLMRRAAD
ncbi:MULTISPECIES: spinster family MFS transporter [Sphingomonas]|uniref:MFS transporter n=1 Tax=Sphingomonas adhaesiva TaxID=28212 RepID=A0A2A4ICF0_9SPHN|nr:MULTISPECIES: MFS transporter [Sphingomonas]PCG16155.1 MFS transporter [Sphingomonas adhaesiva]PZU79680.1 MAG: MFS transporter [Sphingomonas sp.]